MNNVVSKLLLTVLLAVIVFPQLARSEEPVTARLYWPAESARPGDTVPLAVVVQIQDGFHINADMRQLGQSNDFFTPYPSRLAVSKLDEGLLAETTLYPQAKRFRTRYAKDGLMSFAGEIIIYLPVRFADELQAETTAHLAVDFEYQACTENHCFLPQTIHLTSAVEIKASPPLASNQEIFAEYNTRRFSVGNDVEFRFFGWKFAVNGASWAGVLLLLSIAAFGGMLLNFTPCVLPLIPIKIISLSYAAKNRQQCLLLGAAMSLGVLAFWLFLGSLIALVSGFSATNQLFQYPAFTIIVGLIIGIMALGMFDFFAIPLPQWLYLIHPEQDTLHGSFGLGILAAVLSTPCTAPFMGAAAAWAATGPPTATLLVFAAIGSGMALPYLLLSAAPHLVEKMPRSGPASVLVKQVMGLLMLAAAVYFIGIGTKTLFAASGGPTSKLYWWPVMAFAVSAGGWLSWRTLQLAQHWSFVKIFFISLGLLIMLFSTYSAFRLTEKGKINWLYYSTERFAAENVAGKAIVMVFTADWCLNCKALEQSVLQSSKIIQLLNRDEVVPMKVDITGANPAGRKMLQQVGRLSIPLLVVFAAHGKQVYISDFYTPEELYEAVMQALQES